MNNSSLPSQPQAHGLRLTVIGSGTCVPSARRGSPALLIQTDGQAILVDCGPGTLGRLAKLGIGPESIDTLFLTHLHVDHVCDMTALLFANNYGHPTRTADMIIAGAVGLGDFLQRLQGLFEHWIDAQNYKLEIMELTSDTIKLSRLQVNSSQVKHCKSSLAYRFTHQSGKSVVVSGDTDYCQEIIDLARDADLLVLECAFPDSQKVEGHLTPYYAGKIAREAKCKRLLLTHFYPPCDEADILAECRREYSGEIYLAEDFWEYNLDI